MWSGHAKCDSAMCAFVNTAQADGTRGSATAGGTEVEAGIGYSGSRRRRSGGTVLEDEEVLRVKGEGRCDIRGGSEGEEGTGTQRGRDLESEVRRKAEQMCESTHTHTRVCHRETDREGGRERERERGIKTEVSVMWKNMRRRTER